MYKYIIENISLANSNILSLRLRAQYENDIFDYLPGQYAAISYKINGSPSPFRSFSFASSPAEKGRIEFGIRVGGPFTKSITRLKAGDEISVMGPFGNFTLDPKQCRKAVLLAGGIGITPFLSMARTALNRKWPTNISLLYSTRNVDDTTYAAELLKLQETNPNFHLQFFISDQDVSALENPLFHNGRIAPEDLSSLAKDHDTDFYLCGPPAFMTAMKNSLSTQNVADWKIITEAFSQTGNEGKSTQRKINAFAIAGMAAAFILVASFDAHKTALKLNAASGSTSTTTEKTTLPPYSNDDKNSTTPNTATPTPTVTPAPTTTPNYNSYTPPKTGAS